MLANTLATSSDLNSDLYAQVQVLTYYINFSPTTGNDQEWN